MIYTACGFLLKQYDSTNLTRHSHPAETAVCALSMEHAEFLTAFIQCAPERLPLISTYCLTKKPYKTDWKQRNSRYLLSCSPASVLVD